MFVKKKKNKYKGGFATCLASQTHRNPLKHILTTATCCSTLKHRGALLVWTNIKHILSTTAD